MEVIDITPELLETILTTFNTDDEKELTRQSLSVLLSADFPLR